MIMAKAPAKKVTKKAPAKAVAVKVAKKVSAPAIDKVMQQVLEKLSSMGIDQKLQDDIKWCLGSFGFDKNPIGLYDTASRALAVFVEAKANKAKGIPAKLITDLKNVLKK